MDRADLRDWAIENEIHENVLGFLVAYGSMSDHGFIYADLKGWKRVSDLLFVDDDLWDDAERRSWGLNGMQAAIAKLLGDVGAAHFARYLRLMALSSDTFDLILKGIATDITVKDDLSLGEDVANVLLTELTDRLRHIKTSWGSDFKETAFFQDWLQQAENAVWFMDANTTPEIAIMFLRTVTRVAQNNDIIKQFGESISILKFTRKYADVILGA